MVRKHFIIGTAGHIDHGKSTLVEALTGTDPDRLPEEKARGMTIDLGFAHLDLPDPQDTATTYSLGIVDVPGHADFVKNMVAGVGSIDLAMLVIAADDGWMPQTEEHTQILTYLGVPRLIVALTKSDLLDDRDFAIEAIREELAGSPFADSEIIPVCALGGEGLDELKGAIVNELRDRPPPPDYGKPRLHVDRAFSPRGIGTVVTGTLSGGRLEKGMAAVIQPGGMKTVVRNIQSHNANVDVAYPGMRTAMNLSDVGVGKHERKAVRRGDVITLPNLGKAARVIDVALSRSSREVPGQPATTKPIRNGQRVRWHHGGASHSGRIYFLGKRALLPGQNGLAQLRFERPVYAFQGDRFVIRDWPKTSSLAGGIVLDPDAEPKRFRGEAQAAFLQERAEAPCDPEMAIGTLLRRDHAVAETGLLHNACFSDDEVKRLVEKMAQAEDLRKAAGWLIEASWWKALEADLGGRVQTYHREQPDQAGMPLSELRSLVVRRVPHPSLVDPVFESLAQNGFQRIGASMRHESHRAALPPELRVAGDRILKTLADNPLDPPNPKELAPSPGDQKAMRFLMDMGEVIDLGPKCALLAATYASTRGAIIRFLKANPQGTVSAIRQEIGTSRRVLMPILEKMDKENTTVRVGDFRSLSRSYLKSESEAAAG